MTNNLIINGNFDLWQRGITFSILWNDVDAGNTLTAPLRKTADRWYLIDSQQRISGSTGQIQVYKEKFNIGTIHGYGNYVTITNQITGVTSGFCYFENKQFGANSFQNVPLTLSFSAKILSGITGGTLSCYYRQAVNPNTTEFSTVLPTELSVQPYWQKYSLNFTPSSVNYNGISGDHYFSIGFKILPECNISISNVLLQQTQSKISTNFVSDPIEEKNKQNKYYYRSYPLEYNTGDVTLQNGNDLTALNFTVTPSYSYNFKLPVEQIKAPQITVYSPKSGTQNDGYNKSAEKDMRLTSGTRGWNQITRFSPTGASTLTAAGNTYGVAFTVNTGAVIFDDILVHIIADADIDPSPYDRGPSEPIEYETPETP
jgi:hypothetical protein